MRHSDVQAMASVFSALSEVKVEIERLRAENASLKEDNKYLKSVIDRLMEAKKEQPHE